MFKDIILGYYRSPSMGKKIQDYKRKLKNDLKWWIFNIFAIVFVFFTIFLTNILPSKTISNNIVKKTSLNPNLTYTVKSTAKRPLQPKDIISYTLTVTNNSKIVQDSNFEVNISDILEYADLLDGGDYNIKDSIIYWNNSSIEPGESKSKFFAIKIKDRIPTFKKQGESFDCFIKLNFGEISKTPIKCPFIKNIDYLLNSVPVLEQYIILLFLTVLFFISMIMALRTNLLYKEIRYFSQYSGEIK